MNLCTDSPSLSPSQKRNETKQNQRRATSSTIGFHGRRGVQRETMTPTKMNDVCRPTLEELVQYSTVAFSHSNLCGVSSL